LDAGNAESSLNLMKELCISSGASMLVVSHDSNVINSFDHQINWVELNQVSKGEPCK